MTTMITIIRNFFKKLHEDVILVRNHDRKHTHRTVVGPWFM